MATYGISDTDNRIAAFVWQVGEETGFVHLQEDLHYSTARTRIVGFLPNLHGFLRHSPVAQGCYENDTSP
jgi:hypothetical protein